MTKENSKPSTPKFPNVFKALTGYLKGSWAELRLVRWPNRRATWGLTAAVLLFTALFLLIIILLDGLFQQLFNLIIK